MKTYMELILNGNKKDLDTFKIESKKYAHGSWSYCKDDKLLKD